MELRQDVQARASVDTSTGVMEKNMIMCGSLGRVFFCGFNLKDNPITVAEGFVVKHRSILGAEATDATATRIADEIRKHVSGNSGDGLGSYVEKQYDSNSNSAFEAMITHPERTIIHGSDHYGTKEYEAAILARKIASQEVNAALEEDKRRKKEIKERISREQGDRREVMGMSSTSTKAKKERGSVPILKDGEMQWVTPEEAAEFRAVSESSSPLLHRVDDVVKGKTKDKEEQCDCPACTASRDPSMAGASREEQIIRVLQAQWKSHIVAPPPEATYMDVHVGHVIYQLNTIGEEGTKSWLKKLPDMELDNAKELFMQAKQLRAGLHLDTIGTTETTTATTTRTTTRTRTTTARTRTTRGCTR